MSLTVREKLLQSIDSSLAFDQNVVDPPIALLWTDPERQWEGLVASLATERAIVSLGPYDPEARCGPSYWIRCIVAGTLELDGMPDGQIIVYLPGVAREDFRALAELSPELAPLGAIQQRCQWFAHPNGKDWTVRAYFSNTDRGLGLNVATTPELNFALLAGLGHLLDEPVARLEAKFIDEAFLANLLNPDPVRLMLEWISDPAETRSRHSDKEWAAFALQCKQEFGIDLAKQTEMDAARALGEGVGKWKQAWERYRQSPEDYPNIPTRLSAVEPVELLPTNEGAWPGAAERAEESLRADLIACGDLSPDDARSKLVELEQVHKRRRDYVWAQLGWTPLALAIEHLARMATSCMAGVPTGSVAEIRDWYSQSGWQADASVLSALQEVDRKVDLDAIEDALSAAYRPWLDDAAKALQTAVGPMANAQTYPGPASPKAVPGVVTVFIDGLRLDAGHLLVAALEHAGVDAALDVGLAALPTVTQTAKPALAPVISGSLGAGEALDARRLPDGPAAGAPVLRTLMEANGVQILTPAEMGDPTGTAWAEAGRIDHLGHDAGMKLPSLIDDEIREIVTRVRDLLDAGWSSVRLVTDHGWLLVPGGLPKNENLPVAVTEVKKGRCARVKPGASPNVPTVAWFWDNDVRIAVAPGISCFEANKVYEHGGVSPQECFVPVIVATRGGTTTASSASITSMKWRGLTLVVEFTGVPEGAKIDLRTAPGDESTSVADRARLTSGQGRELFLVGDEDLEGATVHVVVVSPDGSMLLDQPTTVGQNR